MRFGLSTDKSKKYKPLESEEFNPKSNEHPLPGNSPFDDLLPRSQQPTTPSTPGKYRPPHRQQSTSANSAPRYPIPQHRQSTTPNTAEIYKIPRYQHPTTENTTEKYKPRQYRHSTYVAPKSAIPQSTTEIDIFRNRPQKGTKECEEFQEELLSYQTELENRLKDMLTRALPTFEEIRNGTRQALPTRLGIDGLTVLNSILLADIFA